MSPYQTNVHCSDVQPPKFPPTDRIAASREISLNRPCGWCSEQRQRNDKIGQPAEDRERLGIVRSERRRFARAVLYAVECSLRRTSMPNVANRSARRRGETAAVCRLETSAEFRPPNDLGRRGVVAVILRGEEMLVIRRSSRVRAPRTICFPGGGIRDGEDEPSALVRECHEEIGVAIQLIRRLWECETAWGVRLGWWLAEIDPRAVPASDPAEVEEILWLRPGQMAEHPDCLESNRAFLSMVGSGEIRLR